MTTSHTVAVVTGGARGIGFELSRQLIEKGHVVLLTDIDAEAARAAAESLGANAHAMVQDVADSQSHQLVADQASRLGTVCVWVNNAGILFAGYAWAVETDKTTAILNVNVGGVMAGSAAAIRVMQHNPTGGKLLNVASISALTPVPGLAHYAATKAAVLSFTTSLQGDLNQAGIRIRARALCPDVVATNMVSSQHQNPGAAMLFSGPKPLEPADVARSGLDLLDSRQIFRVVPRWRGALIRAVDVSPVLGLKVLTVMSRLGRRRQQSGPTSTRGI